MRPDDNFPESNFKFNAPKGMEGDCGDLKVHKGELDYGNGTKYPTIISKWKPTEEDIARIVNGGSIYLYITGHGMPPVSIQTENPWDEYKTELSDSYQKQ